jgi:NADH-quinone oxidoreductase subunit L
MEMSDYIWLIPALPLISFLIISLFAKTLRHNIAAFLGTGSVMLSAIITIVVGVAFLSGETADKEYSSYLYTWLSTGGFTASMSLVLDPLSLVFCFVITFVGALIHLYSVEFMKGDEGFNRFFAYMNLFVGSMLILVMADNLLLLYLGWEGVGLCSYLLIGFWYKDPVNVTAANKAFTVTRIADAALIIGLFLLMAEFNTLNIGKIMEDAPSRWNVGSPTAIAAALLILAGAIGKSAQLPLQTWLPDAMAGPSPVSALIHAATMVTAGVYLITRTHVIFTLAPAVMTLVAAIGAITLLVAGFSALSQTDLKRVLAYSTISQIGYMFFAMGIGAWSASIFHFMIHAFFKALLFLSGGAIIHLLHEEHDIFRMGGLRKKMPVVFYTFLAGAASLAALPLITAGFYSKDAILWFGYASDLSSPLLWIAGVTGSLLTSLYIFRLVILVFYGETKLEPTHNPGIFMSVPVIALAVLSIVGGFVEMPGNLGPVHLFSRLFGEQLPPVNIIKPESSELIIQVVSMIISVGGIYLAWIMFYKKPAIGERFRSSAADRFFLTGWKFDNLYNGLVVKPYRWIAEINRHDFIDKVNNYIARAALFVNSLFSLTQNGRLRWYVLSITIGIFILLSFIISL